MVPLFVVLELALLDTKRFGRTEGQAFRLQEFSTSSAPAKPVVEQIKSVPLSKSFQAQIDYLKRSAKGLRCFCVDYLAAEGPSSKWPAKYTLPSSDDRWTECTAGIGSEHHEGTANYMSSYPVYYINMNEQRDKLFRENWKSFSPHMFRVQAINGYKVEQVAPMLAAHDSPETKALLNGSRHGFWVNKFANGNTGRAGILGCTLSHLRAIKAAYESNFDVVIICEDDASPALFPLWKITLEEYEKSLPPNWQVAQLGYLWPHDGDERAGNEELPADATFYGKFWDQTSTHFVRDTAWAASAYMLHRRGMELIMKDFERDDAFDLREMFRKCHQVDADDCLMGFKPSHGPNSFKWRDNGKELLPETYLAIPPFMTLVDVDSTLEHTHSEAASMCTDIASNLDLWTCKLQVLGNTTENPKHCPVTDKCCKTTL